MRLLVAPDKFAGSLSAVEAADAIASGWRRQVPEVEIDLAPLSDGGPGFLEVVHSAVGGEVLPVIVTGPLGEPVSAQILLVDQQSERIAYLEAAQACGLHLVPIAYRDPAASTTAGVGELVEAAVDAGAHRVVVGLGGSATNDGGAGMLAALGAEPAALLRSGGAALRDLAAVDLGGARSRVAGVELTAASDVDNPLLGLSGATAVFGPQKGADQNQVMALDAALESWAGLTGPELAASPGAGAAGGLGFGLMLLGADRVPGIGTVLDLAGLDARAARADLVVTGEGSLDWQSLRGKVVSGVAEAATRAGRPCIALAGQVEVGRRELAAMGVAAAYSVTDQAGSAQVAMADAHRHLADLAARIAREWSRA